MIEEIKMPTLVEGKKINAIKSDYSRAAELFTLIEENRDFLRKFLPWLDYAKTLEDEESALKTFEKNWDNKTEFVYFITDKENNIIGTFNFFNIDYTNHNLEIGYWLDKKQNGKGCISETIKLFEQIAFDNNFVRLTIKCDPENIPSNNVAKRNEYNLEGRTEKNEYRYGKFYDSNRYAKINPKYK